MISLDHSWLLAIALVLDALFGDPERIWQRLPHPVAIVGGLIGLLDRTLNVDALTAAWRKAAGTFTLVIVVALAMLAGYGLELGFRSLPFGGIGTALIASVLIAGRSLYDHVIAVADAFAEGLPAARAAVSRIVGRDPGSLDQPRVCRAAIESAAENFSDAVIAPAVWFLLLGLPGLFAYKAINTADSMIGHLTPRYEAFGWASARLDDLVNLPASRIAGFLVALAAPAAGGSIAQAVRVMFADAPHHRSPNAGWPEAAMASALGVALAGPRRYAGIIVSDPFVNASGRRDANPTDIRRALRVYLAANGLLLALVAGIAACVLWP